MSLKNHQSGSFATDPPITGSAAVYVVDDDETTRDLLRLLLNTIGLEPAAYESPGAFVEDFDPDRPACVVLDLRMPELNGIETLSRLRARSGTVPVIFLTGYGNLSTVVRAMKLGAVEFFEKPVNKELLLESIQYWIECDIRAHQAAYQYQVTLERLAKLSHRERQVLDCVLAGLSNKETARCLGVGPKSIEIYRAHVMQKMEARNAVTLAIQVAGCLKCTGQAMIRPPCLNRIEQAGLAGRT